MVVTNSANRVGQLPYPISIVYTIAMLVTSVSIGSGLFGCRDLVSCGLDDRVPGIGQRFYCRVLDGLMAF